MKPKTISFIRGDSFFAAPGLGRKARKEFYSALSHIFRGPLVGAAGYSDYLCKGYAGPLSREQLKQLSRVRDSILRLNSVTDAFLDIIAFDLRLIRPQGGPCDIRAVLEGMAADFRQSRSPGRGAVSFSGPDRPLPVRMDPHWAQTLLSELVSNALLLSDGDGVSLSLYGRRGRVHAEIKCPRSRLPPKGKLRLFLPFFRLPENLYPQGGRRGGLAMILVRRIVALHGGTIKARRLGRTGFTVKASLPACAARGAAKLVP